MDSILTQKRLKAAMTLLLMAIVLLSVTQLVVTASDTQADTCIFSGVEYVYLEGVRTPVTDERVLAVTKPTPSLLRSGAPPAHSIVTIGSEWTEDNLIHMNGMRVRSIRYFTEVNGVRYEVFCIDPNLAGPQRAASDGLGYTLSAEITGALGQQLRNILSNGFPSHPHTSSHTVAGSVQVANAYITRVAIAIAGRPNANFTGNQTTISRAQTLVAGRPIVGPPLSELPPTIRVNGLADASNLNHAVSASASVAASSAFKVATTRVTHDLELPYILEWGTGTPAGARLYVDGTHHATAPENNSATVMGDSTFEIRMPNTDEFLRQVATVNLVNPNAAWAGRVWRMHVPGRADFQDIVFYIPEYAASASFSFAHEERLPGRFRILKTDMSENALSGAVFSITGPDDQMPLTVTVPSAGWTSPELIPGTYEVTERTPPQGFRLAANPTQTVTITEGQTGLITLTFRNEREPSGPPHPSPPPPPPPEPAPRQPVRIQKICAIGRYNVPGALMRLQGMSGMTIVTGDGQHVTFDNAGINISQVLTAGATMPVQMPNGVTSEVADGVWTLHGLPFGFYQVVEERAPDGFSLLPQHTSYGFWINPPDVTVAIRDTSGVVIPWDQVMQMLSNMSGVNIPEDATLQDILSIMQNILGDIELVIIPEYQITETPNITSALITFENFPYSEVVVYKREMSNGIGNNQPLAGAHFRIRGFNPDGNSPQVIDRVAVSDENGRVVFSNLPAGAFTVTEEAPPTGYLLGENNVWHVNVGWGQTVARGTAPSHTFFNDPKSALDVIKVDVTTGTRLAGATFELTDPTTGGMWTATTDVSGAARFGVGNYGNYLYPGRTLILRETIAPPGFILDTTSREVVLSSGENELVWSNVPYVYIEITKVCSVTNDPLAGATFVLRDPTTGETWTATTGEDGIAIIGRLASSLGNYLIPGRTYILTETISPPGFILDSTPRDVVLSNRGRNAVVIDNEPYVYLLITKVDGNTNEPLEGATFELRDPTTGEVWTATTDSSGTAITGQGTGSMGNYLIPGRTFFLVETIAPSNYVLNSTPREVVLSNRGRNEIKVANYHNPSLTILKRCQDTLELLAGAIFTVEFENGQTIPGGPFTTDAQGRIVIPNVLGSDETERTLIVTETVAPPGFNLANPNSQRITIRAGEDNVATFHNRRMSGLTILKIDAVTGLPIQGAWFEIYYLGATAGTGSQNIGPGGLLTGNPFVTDAQGRITIPNTYSGRYRIVEIRAANNYWLDPQASNRTWTVEIRDNEDYTLTIENTLLPTLVITKLNALTNRPVPMTHFRVWFEVPNSPNVVELGSFVTNENGQIILPFVQVGWYRIQETRPAPGMSLSTNNHYRVFLQPGQHSYRLIEQGIIRSTSMLIPDGHTLAVTTVPTAPEEQPIIGRNISNAPTPDIPLDTVVEPIEPDMDAITDERLIAESESTAPPVISSPASSEPPPNPDNPQDTSHMTDAEVVSYVTRSLQVTAGDVHLTGENIWNWPLNSIVIKKSCSVTGQLLPGATFEVIHTSAGESGTRGTVIGRFTTGHSGIIVLTGLVPGSFVVEEVSPPNNFTLSVNNTQHVFLQPDGHSIVEVNFANDPYGSLLIIKRCAVTGRPLHNAEFRVTSSDGAVIGSANGLFRTSQYGEILIPNIPPQSVVVTEIRAPSGFILDSAPQTIRINATGQTYRLEFTNSPTGGLLITKRCEVTNRPLPNAEFRVVNSRGTVVGNANGLFRTNQVGEIHIPDLPPDSYIITEVQAPPGFVLDSTPQTIRISAEGQIYRVDFTNRPVGGLQIIKLDDDTRRPIPNVEFAVAEMNGRRIGTFRTDSQGLITIPELSSGWFSVTETRAAPGYILDTTQHSIEVVDGRTAVLTVTNRRSASLMIEKTCSVTGEGIYGVIFILFDSNMNPVMRLTTDQDGFAFADSELTEGRFFLREMHPAEGFEPDTRLRTIQIQAGGTTHVRWTNNPIMGQIQIVKYSYNYNPVTGAPAGTRLQGAVFEITRARSGVVVGHITTDARGVAASPPLPMGRYFITEVSAPPFHKLSETRMEAELEFPGQIVRLSAFNKSVNLGTEIRKVGNHEVIAGDSMRYDISIANTSNVPLSDFYWVDRLPTNATRAQSLTTGTYNQRLYYRIVFRTNVNDWRTLATNLLTTNNYSFNLSPASLGLRAGEFVTEIRFEFGTVSAGFASVMRPSITVQTLPTLPAGTQIINRAEVGGQYGGAPQVSTTEWSTLVVRFGRPPELPRTGH